MRLGLIGLGRIGAFHTNTLVGIPAIDSLVVTDLVPEKTKTIVERFGAQGVEGVDSLEALLGSGIDGVIIAAGTDAHTKLILACVEAGLPTLCEKPVGSNGAEGAELLRRLEGSTVPVQIGFQRRYDAAIAAAKAAVDSGELGWINTIRSTTLDPEPPTAGVRGGVRRDVPRLRGARLRHHPVRHRPGGRRGLRHRHQPGRGVLQAVRRPRHLRRDRDVRERHARRRLQHPLQRPRLRRAAGGARLEGQRRRRRGRGLAHPRHRSPGVEFPSGQPHRFFMDRFQPAFRAEFETFLEVVAGKRPSPCTVADGLEADWIAEACAKSQKEHRPVRIEEVRIP